MIGLDTFYQRQHVENIKLALVRGSTVEVDYILHSADDKAYLQPGTSIGFEGTKGHGVVSLTDPRKSRNQHNTYVLYFPELVAATDEMLFSFFLSFPSDIPLTHSLSLSPSVSVTVSHLVLVCMCDTQARLPGSDHVPHA
jgi:hypothetical protein